ncbi:MAG: glycosyltransferase, partial [Parvularculaceae bacterium]|nr:glycosyltransferase [Parvularculaceae bacterium]
MGKVAIITMVQAADLPQALASLASASRARRASDLHLVLFNDAPNDAIAEKIASASGAEIIRVDRNLGVAGGRNRLVKEARRRGAEFVASVDDDILVPPDFIDILNHEFASLAECGRKPGILTPATLDFHAVGSAIYSAEQLSAIADGAHVDTPPTAKMRAQLRTRDKRRARDIYHMGIADWRGAYFYSGADGDRALQRAYAVEPEKMSGVEAHLRHAKQAWPWILEGAPPIPIDTAPGGVCFYPTALAEEIDYHDEGFNPFGFEDADFALRARKAGYQHFCAPRAIAVHDIAARLSERPIAALRATQGKMAGAFVRKHAESHEAAAAFAAISSRIIEQVTAAGEARRENGAALKTPQRLEALFAYFGNALAFLLPPKTVATTITAAGLAGRIQIILAAAIPNSEALSLAQRADGFEIGCDGKGVSAIVRILADETQTPKISIAIRNAHIGLAFLPPLLAAAACGDLRFDIDAVVEATRPDELTVEHFKFRAPGIIELAASGRFERGEAPERGAPPLRFDSIEV